MERPAIGARPVRRGPAVGGGPAGAGAGGGGGMMASPDRGRGEWRRARLAQARLYVVSGARQDRDELEAFLEGILGAGTDVVQLREKDAEAGDLVRWGEVFREVAARHDALFVLNDRPDVALAIEADGVHLGQNDL